jgi:hypothetical protein
MSNWKLEVRGFRELQATFRDAPRKIQAIGRDWAHDVSVDETKYIVRAAPNKTGKFRKTIKPYSRAFIVGIEFLPYGKLGTKLAKWIIGGTRPHIIRAKRANALRFMVRGKVRFAKFVHHPGTSPNDFVQKGAKAFNPRVRYWLNDLEKRIVKALSK